MKPASAGDAAKAYRLRKALAAGTIMPIDKLWLADYDEKAAQRKRARSIGASRSKSGRKVKFEMEEAAESEAVGTGTAAAVAAAAALEVKEEGRRLDTLTLGALDVLREAVTVYRDMSLMMRRRMFELEETHAELLGAVRDQYLARTQAEINALEASNQGGDAMTKLAESLLPDLLKRAHNGAHKPKPE